MISLIVAASDNGVIGINGRLPWRMPDDLKRFKRLTMGKPIIMGRKTWESIGKPLPGRQNIVLSGRLGYEAPRCDVVTSPAAALGAAASADEIMVIGGSQIYELFLDKATRIYLTRVHTTVDGDAFFPAVNLDHWQETHHETRSRDNGNEFSCDFVTYERLVN